MAPSSTCKQQPDSWCKGLSSTFNLSSSTRTARWKPGGSSVRGTDVQIPPARGAQAQRGAAEQYGTQQEEQHARAEQLPLCLSPAGHGDVHTEPTNANLPPTTCIDKDAFGKATPQCTRQTAAYNFIWKAKFLHWLEKAQKQLILLSALSGTCRLRGAK